MIIERDDQSTGDPGVEQHWMLKSSLRLHGDEILDRTSASRTWMLEVGRQIAQALAIDASRVAVLDFEVGDKNSDGRVEEVVVDCVLQDGQPSLDVVARAMPLLVGHEITHLMCTTLESLEWVVQEALPGTQQAAAPAAAADVAASLQHEKRCRQYIENASPVYWPKNAVIICVVARLFLDPGTEGALVNFQQVFETDVSQALQIPIEAVEVTTIEPLKKSIIVHLQLVIPVLGQHAERAAEALIIQLQDETSALYMKGKLTRYLDPSLIPKLRILTEAEIVHPDKEEEPQLFHKAVFERQKIGSRAGPRSNTGSIEEAELDRTSSTPLEAVETVSIDTTQTKVAEPVADQRQAQDSLAERAAWMQEELLTSGKIRRN